MTLFTKKPPIEIEYWRYVKSARSSAIAGLYKKAGDEFMFASVCAERLGWKSTSARTTRKAERLYAIAADAEREGIRKISMLCRLRNVL